MWAWASLGLLCPTPTRLSWMMESLGALSSHKGCTSSCLLPPHEPLSLLENTVASPPARSPSQPDNIQPFSGQASTPELLCLAQTQFLHVSNWTSTLPLCRWAVQVQRPWCQGHGADSPVGSYSPSGYGPILFPEQIHGGRSIYQTYQWVRRPGTRRTCSLWVPTTPKVLSVLQAAQNTPWTHPKPCTKTWQCSIPQTGQQAGPRCVTQSCSHTGHPGTWLVSGTSIWEIKCAQSSGLCHRERKKNQEP